MTVSSIDCRIKFGDRTWTFEQTYDVDGTKVRVHVHRDPYDFQSRIYSEAWSPALLQWNRVQTLSGSDHPGLPSPYSRKDPTFREDVEAACAPIAEQMLAYARDVLS